MQREKGEFKQIGRVNLYVGDLETLKEFYPEMGYGRVIRNLVHQHCQKLRAKFNQRTSAKGVATENIGEIDDITTR